MLLPLYRFRWMNKSFISEHFIHRHVYCQCFGLVFPSVPQLSNEASLSALCPYCFLQERPLSLLMSYREPSFQDGGVVWRSARDFYTGVYSHCSPAGLVYCVLFLCFSAPQCSGLCSLPTLSPFKAASLMFEVDWLVLYLKFLWCPCGCR